MSKKWLYAGILTLSLFVFNTGFSCSGCNVTHSCGYRQDKESHPYSPGCETMNVTVYNKTDFRFVVDPSYEPGTTLGTFSDFTIVPQSSKTFTITGEKVDDANQDKIDTSIRLLAQYQEGDGGGYKNSGAQFTVVAKKDSCNSKSAELVMSDFRCYYQSRIDDGNFDCKWGGCVLAADSNSCHDDEGTKYCPINCPSGSPHGTTDGVCIEDYDRFYDVDCHYAPSSLVTNAADKSSVTTATGLYTSGVTGNNPDASVAYSTSSYFQCNQSSECGPGDVGSLCNGGTADYNKPATLAFYIYPSSIETLTITFPFNAQSPIAKLMSTTIYNNLSPKNLGGLSTYYSVTPVAVTDTTLAFSTLCNSASCPQP